MKIWKSIFMMLAAFSLASCSSDDDEMSSMQATNWQYVSHKLPVRSLHTTSLSVTN